MNTAPYTLFKVDAALDRSSAELSSRIPEIQKKSAANSITATTPQGFLNSFEPLRRCQSGLETPLHGGGIIDFPRLQAEGKSQLHLTSYQPYSLDRQGPARWDGIEEDVADRLIGSLDHFFPRLADSVIAREDGNIVIRGKIFGSMPMAAKLKPSSSRAKPARRSSCWT